MPVYTSTYYPQLRQSRVALHQEVANKSLMILLGVLIAVMSVLYILKVTTVATKGNDFAKLEAHKKALLVETEQLNIEIAEHRSMKSIEERLKDVHMVRVDEMQYITPTGVAVVRR